MNADIPFSLRSTRILLGFLWKARVTPGRMRRAISLIASDPPRHEAPRSLVKRGFTPRRIGQTAADRCGPPPPRDPETPGHAPRPRVRPSSQDTLRPPRGREPGPLEDFPITRGEVASGEARGRQRPETAASRPSASGSAHGLPVARASRRGPARRFASKVEPPHPAGLRPRLRQARYFLQAPVRAGQNGSIPVTGRPLAASHDPSARRVSWAVGRHPPKR